MEARRDEGRIDEIRELRAIILPIIICSNCVLHSVLQVIANATLSYDSIHLCSRSWPFATAGYNTSEFAPRTFVTYTYVEYSRSGENSRGDNVWEKKKKYKEAAAGIACDQESNNRAS